MIHKLVNKTKRILVSLRFSILSIFIGLIIVTTLSIIVIRSLTFAKELSYTSYEMMHYVTKIVQNQLMASIKPAAIQAQFSANLFEKNVIKDDARILVPYTDSLVKALTFSQRAFWADEHGDYIYARREKDGTITSDVYNREHKPATRTLIFRNLQGQIVKQIQSQDLIYDPRTSEWYQKTKLEKHFWWSDIQIFHPTTTRGISALAPVLDAAGHFKGVIGISISLDYFTQFITNLKISKNGFAFIITAHEDLVAFPNRPPFTELTTKPHQLINVHAVKLPLIDASIDLYKKTKQRELTIQYNGQEYLVTFDPVTDLSSYEWLIGVITPKKDFIGTLERMNILTIAVSLVILIFGIIIVSNLVTRIVKPINALAEETEKIKRFEIEEDIEIQSHIQEVIHLADAIHAMKVNLRSFQKYVPKLVVKQLLELNKDIQIGGERKQLVVFFSDIKNFTAIAEKMDPNVLSMQLGEYFEALTQIIIAEKGTIDKYIGDSIMAFWGAPLTEDDPNEHAARAALRCQAKVKELNANWAKQGKPQLVTRIGIHAGEAIVGNLGSSERINYTAVGDTINTANRLEHVNKSYKTSILVSEAVYAVIKDKFILRMVDCVAVKGRTETVCIYELLGDDFAVVPFDVRAYREVFSKAYAAYKQSHWKEAILHFKECMQIYPNDTLALIFIERCEHHLQV